MLYSDCVLDDKGMAAMIKSFLGITVAPLNYVATREIFTDMFEQTQVQVQKEMLGSKWVLHPSNSVKRKGKRDASKIDWKRHQRTAKREARALTMIHEEK